MRIFPRSISRILLSAGLLVLVVLLTLYSALKSPLVLLWILPKLAAQQGLKLELSSASIDLLSGFSIQEMALALPEQQITVRHCSLQADYSPSQLLQRNLELSSVLIKGCEIILPETSPTKNPPPTAAAPDVNPQSATQDSPSAWNWHVASLTASQLSFVSQAPQLTLENLSLIARDLGSKTPSTLKAQIAQLNFQNGEQLSVAGPLDINLEAPAFDLSRQKFRLHLQSKNFLLQTPEAGIDQAGFDVVLEGDSFQQMRLNLELPAVRLGRQSGGPQAAFQLTTNINQLTDSSLNLDIKTLKLGYPEQEAIELSAQVQLQPKQKKIEIDFSQLDLVDEPLRKFLPPGSQFPRLNLGGMHKIKATWDPLSVNASGEFNFENLEAAALTLKPAEISGTKLKYQLEYADNSLQIAALDLALRLAEKESGTAHLSAKVGLPNGTQKNVSAILNLKASDLDLFQLSRLAAAQETPDGIAAQTATSVKDDEAQQESFELPAIQAEVVLENSRYLKNIVPSVVLLAETELSKIKLNKFALTSELGSIESSGFFDISKDQNFELDAHSSGLDLSQVLAMQFPEQADKMHGKLEQFQCHVSGDVKQWQKSLNAELIAQASDLTLPSKLQHYPPFNLLFLPLEVLSDALGSITGVLLPESISGLGGQIHQQLSESGRLLVNHLKLSIQAKDGQVQIEELDFDPNLLPRIRMQGRIGFDGSLNIKNYFSILKTRVPLPIAGTLRTPLPNVPVLIPEIVKALGLSLIDIAGSITDLGSGQNNIPQNEIVTNPEATEGEK